jgi:ABC-type transport system involved in multi-copper enzyme maturation permease subunit
MVTAVLQHELLLGSRRFRVYVMRWLLAGWLVLQVLWLYVLFQSEFLGRQFVAGLRFWAPLTVQPSAPEVVGYWFAEIYVTQQILLLLGLIPALMAGAITDEKRKGTLQYLLLTEVGTTDLIVGKMLGRLLQVLLVLLAGLPLFALMAGFAGLAPRTLLFVALSLVLPTFGLSSLTMLASVWFRQTRDAVLALYVAGVLGALVVRQVGGPLLFLDPLYCLAPVWGSPATHDLPEATRRLLGGMLAWGLLGGLALLTAILSLRPVYLREIQNLGRFAPRWRSGEREPIEDQPVFWRERFVEGLAPNATLRAIPQWLAIGLLAGLSTLSSLAILAFSLTGSLAELAQALLQLNVRQVADLMPEASTGFLVQGIVAMLLGSLIVGIRASGAITAEREKQTWEALLLSPLTAKSIVQQKMWGILGASYWYLVAYAAPALALSSLSGPLGFLYTLLWLGATVLAMYFIGAAGLWCSVRAPNSWRALLNTTLLGYLGGLAIYTVTSPFIFLLAGMLLLLLALIDWWVGTSLAELAYRNGTNFFRVFAISSAIALVVTFYLLARSFLYRTQRYIADRERVMHWYDEPYYSRPDYPEQRRRRRVI